MDTCTLDVLHDSRDQDVLTVAYCIDLEFFTHQVLINKDLPKPFEPNVLIPMTLVPGDTTR